MRYFKKFDPRQGFLTSKGGLLKFPDFGNGVGGIETDNENLIAEFTRAIQRSVGGIVEVSAAEFEALKKKEPSSKRSNDSISLEEMKALGGGQKRDAVGVRDSRVLVHPTDLTVPPESPKASGFKPKSVRR